MQVIPLEALPNQQFTVVLDSNQWVVTLKTTNGVISVSLTLNNVDIIDNARACANELIIQSQYLESGNFLFLTQNFDLPNYTQFGTTQSLVYLSAADLTALRAAPTLPITAGDFSPTAALPLRFSPQNYMPMVPGMVLWLSAQKLLAGQISEWPDKSGNGNNAIATGVNHPYCIPNSIGGKNALNFIDATQIMSIPHNADMNFTHSVTFFFVGTLADVTNGTLRWLSKAAAFSIGKTSTAEMIFTTLGVQDYNTVSNYFLLNTPIVMAVTMDASNNVEFYKNGILQETITGSTPASTSTNALIVSSAGQPWNGLIAEILFYPTLLSPSQITTVCNYLINEYNIAI